MPLSQSPSPVFPAPPAADAQTPGWTRGWLKRAADAWTAAFGRPTQPRVVETVAATASVALDTASLHQAALEALPDPLLLVEATDPDDLTGRRVTFANAAARDLLRIAQSGALLVSALRHPEVLEVIDESLFGAMASEAPYEPRSAQERVWRVRAVPLAGVGRTAGGELTRRALVHFTDETDARRAEQTRVDFLANASHELRTPLASLSGFIETLRGHAKDDPQAREQFLRIMTIQAERMSRLIEDLMSLSRIELNEHIPPSGACDLSMVALDVADTLKPLTADKQIALELKLPERGLAIVAGDRDQITQVVQNLLDNAVKYSPSGQGVSVEVVIGLTGEAAAAHGSRATTMASAGGGRLSLLTPDRSSHDAYVLLKVADLGAGMMREHLPRLAERFYRVEGQKSGSSNGTGLGLAIVKHIMNRHRGGMLVESAPNLGSTFVVYFPTPARPIKTGP